jgi:hypothetical protein
VLAEELQLTVTMRSSELFEEARRNSRESTRTERKNPGLQLTQRSASNDSPPPGTMPCTCG